MCNHIKRYLIQITKCFILGFNCLLLASGCGVPGYLVIVNVLHKYLLILVLVFEATAAGMLFQIRN